MGRKLVRGAPPPFWGGGLGPHLTQSRLGRGLPPYQVASWSLQPFGRNGYGPKIRGCALLGEGELGPHLTNVARPRLPACQVSSWSVQPFGHNTPTSQTDRTGPTGQRTVSIGRTVLQTVAQIGYFWLNYSKNKKGLWVFFWTECSFQQCHVLGRWFP